MCGSQWNWSRILVSTSRKWQTEREADPNIAPFHEWVRAAVNVESIDINAPDGMDTLLLCTKPANRVLRYARMKAYGNHLRVEDSTSATLQTYDSGVASVFEVPTVDARDVSVNYVKVLKDIFKLDYGPLHTPVILLRCEWIKRQDNYGNPTYLRDDSGFLLVNSRHKLPRMAEPFIFPS